MLSLQQLSDRAEIQDLMVRYGFSIDDGNWDGLDLVFTPDAVVDYTSMGGIKGSYPKIKAWFPGAMTGFPRSQHAPVCSDIQLDGDTARARTVVFNPMIMDYKGSERVFFVGAWYEDKLVRTADGWRIKERVELASWDYNTPDQQTLESISRTKDQTRS